MPRIIMSLLILLASVIGASAKVVVFWQEGFPTVDSAVVPQETLRKALEGMQPVFASLNDLQKPETFRDADLLVLPYGSAVPVDGWKEILAYLRSGGNLLVLGGRPLFVPVWKQDGEFIQGRPQNAYSRALGIWHTYDVPQKDLKSFAWAEDCPQFQTKELGARRVFVLGMWWGRPDNRGLGYFLNSRGAKAAAPVVKADFQSLHSDEQAAMRGARGVFLSFEPEPGYWTSAHGVQLIREAADYARRGATLLWLEMQNLTLAEGERPQLVVHLRDIRRQRAGLAQQGVVRVELLSGPEVLAWKEVNCSGDTVAASVQFENTLPPGFYAVRGSYEDGGKVRETYQTGFWSRDAKLLRSGSTVEAGETYFRRDGAPYIPFGTNYFTTDSHGWGFAASGNASVWERDFAEMEKHGVNFVRTGVWSGQADLMDPVTGGVEERFLRGLEAYLHSAARHKIHVNFTLCAFDPQTVRRYPGEESLMVGPGTNPYTDPVAVRGQENYVLSIVSRFKDVPNLSWDLINEPSFSNPKRLWRGNTPNADPTEIAAWNRWLEQRYGSVQILARAWNITPEELGAFGSIPLPAPEDLEMAREGNAKLVRAFDYNLFAQEMFDQWVSEMIRAIRSTGSRQMVDVGQDEGGVADRVLNQFYGGAGVAFTVNHTWWRDDVLLWDSLVAKRPGLPNLIGETGVQPVWRMDSSWRWDEVAQLGLFERKLALGLAAANSGTLQWDWSRDDVHGIKRSDGSEKIWEDVLTDLAGFAEKAAPYATEVKQPEVAIVLPQSLQLSVLNPAALEAQQKCVRALYHYARASAYVVGEYQIELLGNPKLIILPSPWVFSQKAWEAILGKVREGAVLLLTGRFDADEHFHPTNRPSELGLDYQPGLLATRENLIEWPGGRAWLSFSGEKTTFMERAFLASGRSFLEKPMGKGKLLYSPLPLELNDNLKAIGEVYRYALDRAGVSGMYTTDMDDPGLLVCPTAWKHATLYVLTSESSSLGPLRFTDAASGKEFRAKLDPGRAAVLLISRQGEVLASYNWKLAP